MKTLLLVEDEKLIRQGIRTMIERSGVPIDNIIECNNGESALEYLKNNKVDAMFTDIRMPKMDGIELVKKVQELDHIPLIAAISGFDDFKYAVEMLRNGVKEYISKPVDRMKITAVLNEFNEYIESSNKNRDDQRTMSMQQLQYMLFNDNITRDELAIICSNAHKYIPVKEFIVVCMGSKEDDFDITENGKYYYVQGKEDLNMIICDTKYRDELLEQLSNYYIGISKAYYNFFDVKQAFCEAAEMRRTAFITSTKIVDNTEFELPDEEFQYGYKLMMQTANLICSKKLNEAIEQLKDFANGVKERKYSVKEFQEQMNIIILTIKNVYEKNLRNKDDEVMEVLNMFSYQNIDEYMKVVLNWIQYFDELVSVDDDLVNNNEKMEKAIDFINKNYSTDLNMAVVSNHISMNYSLFSYTFKQYTGTNFVNFLKNIRIGEAKKLLTETDMKINEVSFNVGYEHEKHFMKTFKQITGVTPSQYRKSFSD